MHVSKINKGTRAIPVDVVLVWLFILSIGFIQTVLADLSKMKIIPNK